MYVPIPVLSSQANCTGCKAQCSGTHRRLFLIQSLRCKTGYKAQCRGTCSWVEQATQSANKKAT